MFLCFATANCKAQKSKAGNLTTVAPEKIAEDLSGFDVYYYYLRLWVDIDKKAIRGSNTIHFNTLKDLDSLQIDLFAQYELTGVTYKGQWMKHTRKGNKITVHFPEKLAKNIKASVQVHYAGTPPVAVKPPWQGGFVWAKDSLKRDWVGIACEQLGASSWWPCKDDLSDEPDSVHLTVNVPQGMFCVSNGQLRKIYSPEDNRYTVFDWYITYPVNIYNITLNIGYYDRIRDFYTSERKDPAGKNYSYAVDYFFLDYNIPKAKAFFADSIYGTKTMLKTFEHYFGAYPFPGDGYALVETPYWGMEHQGAIAYGNNFKLNDFGFDFILVHESAHEWWGNAISCKDAGDMWIHESFTTYAEALFVERLYSYSKSVEYLKMQKPNIQNKFPVQGPRNINFHAREDNDIYYKGSWMLHTLRSALDNDSLWFSILYGLQVEFRYKTVSTEDITGFIEKKSGKDLKAFFQQYLYESKLPTLQYFVENKGGKSVLKYKWINSVIGFDMPVDIYVNGKKMRIQPTEKLQSFSLEKNVKTDEIKIYMDRFLIHLQNGI